MRFNIICGQPLESISIFSLKRLSPNINIYVKYGTVLQTKNFIKIDKMKLDYNIHLYVLLSFNHSLLLN